MFLKYMSVLYLKKQQTNKQNKIKHTTSITTSSTTDWQKQGVSCKNKNVCKSS